MAVKKKPRKVKYLVTFEVVTTSDLSLSDLKSSMRCIAEEAPGYAIDTRYETLETKTTKQVNVKIKMVSATQVR